MILIFQLNIQSIWGIEETISLHFGPPLMSCMTLHTAKQRKFLQIIVTGLTVQHVQLTEPELTTPSSADVTFKSLNPIAGQKLVVGNGIKVSFMWEMELGQDQRLISPVKIDFRVRYFPIKNTEDFDNLNIDDDPLHINNLEKLEKSSHIYRCNFDVTDYVVRN